MKLGRRSQSMPWISCPGIISTQRRGGGGWKQTQISWYGGTSTIPLHPLLPSTHSFQSAFIYPFLFPPSCSSFAFLPSLLFVCPWAENSVCLCVRVCVKALWNDALIHSVLYFLIWLTITVRVNRHRISLSRSLSFLLSPYFFPSLSLSMSIRVSCCWMECCTSVYEECCIAVTREGFGEWVCVLWVSVVCFVPVCVCLYALFWNTMQSIEECMLLLCTVWGHMVVLRPVLYIWHLCVWGDAKSVFYFFPVHVLVFICVQEDLLVGICIPWFLHTLHLLKLCNSTLWPTHKHTTTHACGHQNASSHSWRLLPESIEELFNASCCSTSLKLEHRITNSAARAQRLGRAPFYIWLTSLSPKGIRILIHSIDVYLKQNNTQKLNYYCWHLILSSVGTTCYKTALCNWNKFNFKHLHWQWKQTIKLHTLIKIIRFFVFHKLSFI